MDIRKINKQGKEDGPGKDQDICPCNDMLINHISKVHEYKAGWECYGNTT